MVLHMLYVIPMLLGRTYDARTNSIGVDIFPKEVIENPRVKPETMYTSYYKKVDSSADARAMLGIKGDLSLKIKGNAFAIKGAGSYLQETNNKENSIDILVSVVYKTQSVTIPPSVKPLPHWMSIDSKYLGTHFVQSIIYGGDLYACLRFKALKTEYMQDIKGAVAASLETGSALELVAEGRLEKLQKELQGKANIEVSYYATVPLEGVPNTIEGLKKLVTNFEDHVKKVNNGWGVPVEVELAELSMYNTKIEYMKNNVLDSELGNFEEYLDDLLSTKSRIKSWVSNLPDGLSKEKEQMIDDLRSRISETLQVFYSAIAELDITKSVEQLSSAKMSYKKNAKSLLPGKFKREFEKLLRKIGTQSEQPPQKGHSTYVNYGRRSCPHVNGTSTVYSGYLASSSVGATGSGVDYMCLPKDPSYFKSLTIESTSAEKQSTLQGIKFGLIEDENPFKTEDELILKGVVCSVCLVEGRTSATTLYNNDRCPDNWVEEYAGFVLSTESVSRAQYICIDESPESNTGNYMDRNDQSIVFVKTPSSSSSSVYKEVPCVVCSK